MDELHVLALREIQAGRSWFCPSMQRCYMGDDDTVRIEFSAMGDLVQGGSNEIHVNGTTTEIQFQATEQIQNIYNFDGGIIDISALPNCADHTIAKFDDGVEISAGYELLRFHNTSIEIVEECLKTSV